MSQGWETEAATGEKIASDGAQRAAFVQRLQQILRQWPSADRLARAMNVSPSAFRKWLKGEAEPSRERLIALAETARVSIGWLAKGEGPTPSFTTTAKPTEYPGDNKLLQAISPDQFVVLPKRPEAAAAGGATTTPPVPESEYIAFRQDWIRGVLQLRPEHLIMELAVGESMLPTIHDGDLLLIDTDKQELANFGIYVLEITGERVVKRVQRKHDGTIVLISDNPAYELDAVPAARSREIVVVGKVVWSGGKL